ncbi:hypothetical protein AQB9606_02831 [Aquabacterium sp. CECT 9606]|nr:hypothetical protein AQB9606_02831 [Aquabacterium sp. CECT 9606]
MRVLLSLGMSYVAYRGMDVLLGWVKVQAFNYLGQAAGVSSVITQIMGVLQIGTCLNIWFSALGIYLGLRLSGGVVKKLVTR